MSAVCSGGAGSGSGVGSGGGGGERPFQFPQVPAIPEDADEVNLDLVLALFKTFGKGLSESSSSQNEAGDEIRGSLSFLVVVVVAARRRGPGALSMTWYLRNGSLLCYEKFHPPPQNCHRAPRRAT